MAERTEDEQQAPIDLRLTSEQLIALQTHRDTARTNSREVAAMAEERRRNSEGTDSVSALIPIHDQIASLPHVFATFRSVLVRHGAVVICLAADTNVGFTIKGNEQHIHTYEVGKESLQVAALDRALGFTSDRVHPSIAWALGRGASVRLSYPNPERF